MARTDTQSPPRRGPRSRPAALVASVLASVLASALALSACSDHAVPDDPRDRLCARLVRFHLGMHHPVEVTASEHVEGTQNVRIAYRGTRRESSSEGTALCRMSDRTGKLLVHGAYVDGKRLEDQNVQAFNRFVEARQRIGG